MATLARAIGTSRNLKEAFKHASKKRPDALSFKAFARYISEMISSSPSDGVLPQYTDHQKHKLFSYMDLTESDVIYFEDFEAAVFGSEFLPTQASLSRDEEVLALLYRRRYMLRDLFRRVDEDARGTVDVAEFKAGLEAFSEANGSVLSGNQIDQLTTMVKKEDDGGINYEAFIGSIHVVDVTDDSEESIGQPESGASPETTEAETNDNDILL
jgi:hypothetical protein